MAKFLDYEGLSKYDALIKALIEKGDSELAYKLEEIAALVDGNDTTVTEKLEELAGAIEQTQTTHSTDMQLLNTTISALESKHDAEIENVENRITQTVNDILDGAPEMFDTLKEIADWIGSDATGAADLISSIETNTVAIEENKAAIEADVEELAQHIEAASNTFAEHDDRLDVVEKMLGIDNSDSEFEGEDIFTKLDNLETKHDSEMEEMDAKHEADVTAINKRLDIIMEEEDSPIEMYMIDMLFNAKEVAGFDETRAAYTTNALLKVTEDFTWDAMTDGKSTPFTTKNNSVIDLNNHSVELVPGTPNYGWGIQASGKNAVIENGTLNYNVVTPIADGKEKSVIVFPQSMTAEEGLTLKNVVINSEDEVASIVFALNRYKTVHLVMEDCVINMPNATKFAIVQNGTMKNVDYVIKNTTINVPNGIGLYISNNASSGFKHNVVLDGCTIVAKDPIEVKHTNLTVKNCTITSTATEQKYVANGNGTCCEGYGIAVTSNGDADAPTGSLVAVKNTFKGINGNPIYVNGAEGVIDITCDTDITYKA